jgi:hypothetical protein
MEEIMGADFGSLERRGLARGVKIVLDIVFYLALVVGVMLVVSLPISAFTDYDEGWEVIAPVVIGESSFFPRLPVEVEEDASPILEQIGISHIQLYDARGKLKILHHDLPLHLGYATLLILFGALALWVITLLRRILATTAGGRPFDPANPRRLNMLGWTIVSASALSSLLQYLASRWILSRIEVVTFSVSPVIRIHQEWIICGLIVLVLAAVWKEAVLMAEEQSLTV